MRVDRLGTSAFLVAFDDEEEVRREHGANLQFGGIALAIGDPPPLNSEVDVTLRGAGGGETTFRARVVAPLPGGVAVTFPGDPSELLRVLLESVPQESDSEEAGGEAAKSPMLQERLRQMSRAQKVIFAAKADRTERALLLQDNDPQVLSALLRNPRVTVDEVLRVAKSPFLTYQIAEVILANAQFTSSVEVRVALVHNPKTPTPFALRLLPTLPESEVRVIARGAATSMQLRQAAIKRLQGGR